VASHAIVVAPPYSVVDVTIKQHPYPPDERDLLPEIVLSEIFEPSTWALEDLANPQVIETVRLAGMPFDAYLPREVEELPRAHHCEPVYFAMHESSVASALSSINAFCIARKPSCRSRFRAASTPTASARACPLVSTSATGKTHVGATNVGVCGALIGLR
jgi:hypothetical protein